MGDHTEGDSVFDGPAGREEFNLGHCGIVDVEFNGASEMRAHLIREAIYMTVLTDITFDAPSMCRTTQVDQRGMTYGIGNGIEHARPVVFAVHRTYIALVDGLVLE